MMDPTENHSTPKSVLNDHVVAWMSMAGVEAVGIGHECVVIYFLNDDAKESASIPNEVENVRIEKKVSDKFDAQ